MVYLVDTDVIIDGLNQRSAAIELLDRIAAVGLAISVVSLGELFEGGYTQRDPVAFFAKLQQFLSGYQTLRVDQDVMHVFAQERARLRREGRMISDFDLVIGAIAIVHSLRLVSRNRRHFQRL